MENYLVEIAKVGPYGIMVLLVMLVWWLTNRYLEVYNKQQDFFTNHVERNNAVIDKNTAAFASVAEIMRNCQRK